MLPCTVGASAVVSRIVPDEAIGRWEIQDLCRFQRRSSKAYSSGPVLVAQGLHFGLLVRLGGKDAEFASDLQVYAVNLSAKRIMGQHAIRVVNQTRGRDADVALVGEPGLWEPKSEWGWKQAMSLESLEDPEAGFLVDDCIHLELHMQVWEPEAVRTQGAPTTLLPRLRSVRPPSSSLGFDLSGIRRAGFGLDISVRGAGLTSTRRTGDCGGDGGDGSPELEKPTEEEPPLRAHRVILAARSPVFEKMFFSTMREAGDDVELRLDGADMRVARWFLNFIYTDEVPADAWEDPEGLCYLLQLAHRYQVSGLVERCQARLVERLSEESAPERLMMADLLDSPVLKGAVLEYMCASHRRLARIQATEGYARLVRSRPQLLQDMLAAAVPPAPKRARTEVREERPQL